MSYLKKSKERTVDALFLLSLFVVFGVISLLVIHIGANLYQTIATRMKDNLEIRTYSTYLDEKIKQYDTVHSVSVTDIKDCSVLVLTQHNQDYDTNTYLYGYDGTIREYVSSKADFAPEDGTPIVKAKTFHVEFITNSLLKFTITDTSGNLHTLYQSLHTSNS